jgi:hypothetical protein
VGIADIAPIVHRKFGTGVDHRLAPHVEKVAVDIGIHKQEHDFLVLDHELHRGAHGNDALHVADAVHAPELLDRYR